MVSVVPEKRQQSIVEEVNRIIGKDLVQNVEFADRGSVADAAERIDPAQSFIELMASSHRVLPGVKLDLIEDAAAELQRRLAIPDSLLPYVRGIEYLRLAELQANESSIYDLVLRRYGIGGDANGHMQTFSDVSHCIPLGMLRDKPGTLLFFCV